MLKSFVIKENISDPNLETITSVAKKLDAIMDGFVYSGYPLKTINENKSFIKGLIISNRGIYQFVSNENEQDENLRDILKKVMENQELSKLYFENKLKIKSVNINDSVDTIYNNISNDLYELNEETVYKFNALIQNILDLIPKDDRNISKDNSLGKFIQDRNKKIASLDETQFATLYTNNNENLRIRGLAGSGKTILLVKKMAYLHFKDPSLNIAYVFYTKSLKQYIENMFLKFFKEFDKEQQPNMSKIHILHAWGGEKIPGFYSLICKHVDVDIKGYSDGSFEKICKQALDSMPNGNLNIYDYIFIDEAQDFRHNFYKLARKALKSVGKLIYAYDELQTLDDYQSKMPTKKDIFGDDNCLDVNLKECYRCPNEILTSAHALGLGIYHKNADDEIQYINYVDDLNVLNDVGYIVDDGKLEPGQNVSLKRNIVIEEQDYEKIITQKLSQNEQINYVIDEIKSLLKNEDVSTDDILIIDMDAIKLSENFVKFKQELLSSAQDDIEIVNTNLVNKDTAINFRFKNSIPYTTVFRAKGNEANIVFIMNANKLNVIEMFNRNRIFTAMTRAKFKVYILGDGKYMDDLCDEIKEVKNNNYKLNFKCLSVEDQRIFKNKLYADSKKADDIQRMLETLKTYENDPDLYIKLIREQENYKEILEKLRDILNNEDN